MKHKQILMTVLALTLSATGFILMDLYDNQPENRPDNPFELKTDSLRSVPASEIGYKLVRQFRLDSGEVNGIACFDNLLWIATNRGVATLDTSGLKTNVLVSQIPVQTITINGNCVFTGSKNHVLVLDKKSLVMMFEKSFSDSSLITSLAFWGNRFVVADAGKRCIYLLSKDGTIEQTIDGTIGREEKHGFVVPGPYFDVAVNSDNELWVVNPGGHAFENYSTDGAMRSFWSRSAKGIYGFLGCCNPAHFAFLPNGYYVTAEKGVVRIKVFKASGEPHCYVDSPMSYIRHFHAPELAVDEQGSIYALDFEQGCINKYVAIK